ncbi:lysozyme [Streptomyces sp. NE06-03E]|uniref:Lysozyme n=1 Tax=Streptomyces sp. gb1(2016) TaxID=1828321 RepID=A0A652KV59_9ACTN|nr:MULTISPECIES: lysozyme [unclassified Streptomyces]WSS64195.1 lysozyme [Streptomyces sp. NBC_01177]WSS78189.1 lysozyme [Streptomyces sp. NBC_01174]MDX3059027.1 lysozyme [Streptomyces sp. NE06-03E]MDX3430936.1 lysozyme [Streptomyces sp. ME01-18a]RPK50730.1 Lysozyme M1 precursor [Streptomyces sp. ADI93-02]
MPVHRSGTAAPARRRLFAGGTLLAALALLLTLPGAASAADTAAVPERGTARMGQGVIAHDGQGGTPSTGTSAVQTEGVDVASHQGNVAWSTLWNSGVKWAYVKATEGTYYKNTYFTQQYTGSYNVGMIRGTYHFATPDTTSGAAQANYFVDNGGGWSKDGRTLPGVLDIEWNPYGAQCYGKTQAAMVSWIRDFVNTYKARTGRDAVIYTATSWWKDCTGNNAGFGTTNPLWVARYNTTVGELPAGWGVYTIWQYTSSGPTVGDHNHFNGALDRVVALANG